MSLYRYVGNMPIDLLDLYGQALHHPYPLYLGGSDDQLLLDLPQEQHDKVTEYFRKNFPYGGQGAADWAKLTDAQRRSHIE